ncbi:hypothetical protein [Streptomyces sp. NPDC049949]
MHDWFVNLLAVTAVTAVTADPHAPDDEAPPAGVCDTASGGAEHSVS